MSASAARRLRCVLMLALQGDELDDSSTGFAAAWVTELLATIGAALDLGTFLLATAFAAALIGPALGAALLAALLGAALGAALLAALPGVGTTGLLAAFVVVAFGTCLIEAALGGIFEAALFAEALGTVLLADDFAPILLTFFAAALAADFAFGAMFDRAHRK